MLYAGTQYGYLYRSKNGADWENISDPLRGGRSFFGLRGAAVFNDALYVGSISHGEIWKSHDGTTWTLVFDSTPGLERGYVASMIVNNEYLYAGIRTDSGFVFRTSNGRDWEVVGNLSPHTIEAMAVFNKQLYAGTLIPPQATIYRAPLSQ